MAQSLSASLQKSPVFDEPPHIASGLSYLETRVRNANQQHPPLLKEISALFLMMAGVHWPKASMSDTLIRRGPEEADKVVWPIGVGILHNNGADRVLFWARLPFILLGGLLGWLIYWWGRDLVGSVAALGALFFYAFDPTMIAHSAFVTTDAGVTAFMILFLFTLWRFLHNPAKKHLIFCGLALGAVLGAKFSAILILPATAVLMAAALLWPIRTSKRAGRESRTKDLMTAAGRFALMCAIAAVVIEAIYLFNSDPFLYIAGMDKISADHFAGYQGYLHGQLASRFLSYFAVTYLVKEPLAAIVLAIAGLVIVLRRKSMPIVVKLFLLLTPALFFLATTVVADDLGIRYLIPALPFAYLLAGLALAELLNSKAAWGRYAAAALCLWVVVEAIGIYPDHLSYFNESACLLESPGKIGWDGGSACGPLWLDDNNVDWGQGIKQLKAWLDDHAQEQMPHLAYFGSYPPEAYGLNYQNADLTKFAGKPSPGLYAVSSHMVARARPADSVASATKDWLRSPTTIVGHAYYIYDVQ